MADDAISRPPLTAQAMASTRVVELMESKMKLPAFVILQIQAGMCIAGFCTVVRVNNGIEKSY